MNRNHWNTLAGPLLAIALLQASAIHAEEPISFLEQVRPILSDKCFTCHGPDEGTREAGLRLDTQEGSRQDLGGYAALVEGDPAASELMTRIESNDPDLKMPPASTGKQLSPAEVEVMRKWIKGGAKYEKHWSFRSIERPAPPVVPRKEWSRNPIDAFVLAKLEEAGLEPSAPADRYELVRRLYLDLIGIPPTVEEVDAFVHDDSTAAVDNLVERLLDSPHFGERWARRWLDLARYADTKGYEKDQPRTMWPYRDWVISAINADMPFDQFTIEQLAGDMLPSPTTEQLVATGFHRNTMTNEEGGIDPQEYRFLSIVDRVATTGSTWLGLTVGCAQCHTHKYDPITHHDYYRMFALLNNSDELEVELPSDVDPQRARIQSQIDHATAMLRHHFPVEESEAEPAEAEREAAFQQAFGKWLAEERDAAVQWKPQRPTQATSNLPTLEVLEDESVLASGDVTKGDRLRVRVRPDSAVTALRLEALPHPSLPNHGPGRQETRDEKTQGRGGFFLSEAIAYRVNAKEDSSTAKQAVPWGKAYATFVPPGLEAGHAIDQRSDTGWTIYGKEGKRNCLVLTFEEPLHLGDGEELEIELQHDAFYPASLGRFRISTTDAPTIDRAAGHTDAEWQALGKDAGDWTPAEKRRMEARFCQVAPELAEARTVIDKLEKSLPQRLTALVFGERTTNPRATKVHHRGEYLQPKGEVSPGIPEFLATAETAGIDDRLEMARWIVSRDNPLTARVVVNRWWETIFGTGLVKTSSDFGLQGEYPSHAELLDWLASELMDSGWSRKHVLRLIVTSQTYRQSSAVTAEHLEKDPANRLLARMPRTRMEAELVRDSVLQVSGLLSTEVGGPSVFPPQPEGITESAYGPLAWEVSEGGDRYRRGMYTFAKRTAPYAAFGLFDCPSGETSVPKRDRSSTPLQCLALLNDEVVAEAARSLALECYDPTTEPNAIAELLFRRCVARPPTDSELLALREFFDSTLHRLHAGELTAAKVLNSGPATEWTFENGTGGWQDANQVTLAAADGLLQVNCHGDDPFVRHDAEGPSGPYVLELTARFSNDDTAQIFWTTLGEPEESAENSTSFTTLADQWKTYRIPFHTSHDLHSMRIDLGSQPGTHQIERLSLTYGDGLVTLPETMDREALAAWHLVGRALLNLDETITKP